MKIVGLFDSVGFVDSVGRDLRFALRGLARRPTFTFAAVLTLALGIGATTAIFSVVYSVLIKPLPYPNSHELVRIRHVGNGRATSGTSATATMYLTYRDENRTFVEVGIWDGNSATLTDRGEPQRVRALVVSDGLLQALGVQPARGRWFTEAEHGLAAEGPTPVILSHAFWQRRLGGDEAVLDRELSLEPPSNAFDVPFATSSRVVGIMPPGFRFLDMTPQPDVILPMRIDPAAPAAGGQLRYGMLARLKPEVTPAAARADLERMLVIWSRDADPSFRGIRSAVLPSLKEDLVGGVASALWVILGAIGAVLLIACANIANLMLVRADARRHELAVRAALGARPKRIARELFAESLVIGAAGGALGLLLAYLGLRALVTIGPSNLPRLEEISVYPPVLVFTVAVSLAATLVFGSITALKVALRSDARALGAPRGATASRERSATRSALVVVQVGLAVVLVVSAALMVRSFQALRTVDSGFSDPATIQTADVWMPTGPVMDFAQSAQWTRVQHEILDRIAALPGVASAGFVDGLPIEFSGVRNSNGFAVEGRALEPQDQRPQAYFKFVSPGYFETMGTRLIAGRGLAWSDIETGGRVVVVSEEFARQLAAEPAAAVGLRIRFAIYDDDAWREVIGVVQSIHEEGLYEEPPAMVYWPAYSQNLFGAPEIGTPEFTLAVRSERAGTASLVEEIRQAVRSVSATMPVVAGGTMRDVYADSLARTSFTLVMLAIAGAMALALGVIGIYGVIAYVVSQRTREIGIRSALGAEARQLKKMFLLHGLGLSAVGAVVGVVAAMALGRLLSSLLFGVGPMDPAAYAAALGVTIAAAALASYVPARRAASIDPIETLRAE
jgi:putative ABC transport system permease protein